MTGKDWLWSFGGLLAGMMGMIALLGVGRTMVGLGMVPLPGSIPAALDPILTVEPAAFRELIRPGATGHWGLVILLPVCLAIAYVA